jgi:hypothetical protein
MTRYHRGMRFALLAVMLCGCPHGDTPRTGNAPTVAEVVDHMTKARAQMTSFVADANMDYWLGNQRAKGEVLVMGQVGAKVRFAALSPAGGSTMAEMACNGKDFIYVDYQNNCQLSGPCDATSIAHFFHIELQPDDFVHLALGTPPVVSNATGTVRWDGNNGWEKIELHGTEGTQKLTIDDKNGRWDVIDSELVGSDGKVRWSVANKGFDEVAGHRVPGKTSFKSPTNKEDLLIDWGAAGNRKVNDQLPDDKFKLAAPAGLPTCGQKTAALDPAPVPASAPASKSTPVIVWNTGNGWVTLTVDSAGLATYDFHPTGHGADPKAATTKHLAIPHADIDAIEKTLDKHHACALRGTKRLPVSEEGPQSLELALPGMKCQVSMLANDWGKVAEAAPIAAALDGLAERVRTTGK